MAREDIEAIRQELKGVNFLLKTLLSTDSNASSTSGNQVTGNNLLTDIKAIQTDKSQFTKITDGTETLLVNADGSINVSGNILANNGFVRKEQELGLSSEESIFAYTAFRTYDELGTQTAISSIITEEVRAMPLEQRAGLEDIFKTGIVEVVEILDSPAVGDKTTYICYNRNAINKALGTVNIADAQNSIKRIIEKATNKISIRWAENQKFKMDLVFDDGSQNYLTYTYS